MPPMCHILSNENRFPRVYQAYYQVLVGSDSRAGAALMQRRRHANLHAAVDTDPSAQQIDTFY